MNALDKETIKELTKLSHIECSEEEQHLLLQDLKKILNYVDLLQEVNTENVKPCYQVLEEMVSLMRDDVVGPSFSREIFLANAPSQVGGMIRVPAVIKQN